MTPRVQRAVPPYMQVVNYLREQIESGALAEGDTVPSLRAIQKEYGIANATAVKVLAALKSEGLVTTQEGVGTVVARRKSLVSGPDRLQLQRSTGSGFRQGEHVEVLVSELIPAPADVAEILSIQPGDAAIQRRRVYRDDTGVVTLSTSWLPADLADAAPELLSTEQLPAMTFGLLEERTGRRASRRRDVVAVRHTPSDVADVLGIEVGEPVLTMTNTYWDQYGAVTEHAIDFLGPGRELVVEAEL